MGSCTHGNEQSGFHKMWKIPSIPVGIGSLGSQFVPEYGRMINMRG